MARTNSRILPARTRQPTTGGLGVHFVSPIKRRDKRKSTTIIRLPGHIYKYQTLVNEIEALMRQTSQSLPPEDIDEDLAPMDIATDDTTNGSETIEVDQALLSESQDAVNQRTDPNDEANGLYDRWKNLLPSLVDSLLSYDNISMGNVLQITSNIIRSCSVFTCARKVMQITALYFDRTHTLHLRGPKLLTLSLQTWRRLRLRCARVTLPHRPSYLMVSFRPHHHNPAWLFPSLS
jgi:hypothetical protein